VRHAPEPVSEPGPRAFWRVTQQADSCAEGQQGAQNGGA
jgi:hypothetical protein